MKTNLSLALAMAVVFFASCTKEVTETPPPAPISNSNLVFKFKFDSTQVRLNNIGQPSVIPAGNAAQSPVFNSMSAHYVELAPSAFTALGAGQILYKAAQTEVAGQIAIEFEKAKFAGNNEVFYSMPIKDIKPGNYEWLRLSTAIVIRSFQPEFRHPNL